MEMFEKSMPREDALHKASAAVVAATGTLGTPVINTLIPIIVGVEKGVPL